MLARRSRFSPLLLVILSAALLALGACSGDQPTPDPASPATAAAEIPEPPATPPTAEELAPTLREARSAAGAPEKLVVEFAQAVVAPERVGATALKGTVLEVRPPVEGELRYTSPSTLVFVPKEGFAPGRSYEAELKAVGTPAGVVNAPADGRWTRVFETPEFDFVRFALGGVDFAKKNARVELVFSSAVNPLEVSRRARLELIPEGSRTAQTARVRYAQGSSKNTVMATVSGNGVAGGTEVVLHLDEGVPSTLAPELTAKSVRRSVELELGPVTRVLAGYRAEGESGFYVQVICDDTSVPTRRYYWDRVNYDSYQISTRCLLDEADARVGLHFEPEVDFTISPAGGGFRIFGDFERGNYNLRIDAGLRTADGGMLHEAWETEINIPARSPKLDFISRGRYLPRTAWKSLPIRHRNVSSATLLVRHVPAENLVFWMSDTTEATSERTANLVVKKEVQLRGPADEEATSYVDLASLIPADVGGLLEVQVLSGSARATSRLLLTDLHLIAKRGAPAADKTQEVQVWTVNVDSLEPQRGVEVALVRPSGYTVARCETDGGGGCLLRTSADEVDPTKPFALIARRGSDLTYLKFKELKAEVQETRVAGDPYRGNQKYRAAVYSERGVYRPGETAHLAAIVRQENHEAPPEGMPVQLAVLDPQGKVIRRNTLNTNGAGYLEQDVSFPAFASTGRYVARLEVAKRPVGQYTFQVEEFVPERMRVEVTAEEEEFQLGESLGLQVKARYLFGGVPSGNRLELACELAPGTFAPEENSQFHYGVWNREDQPVRPLDLGVLEAQLDGDGEGTYACPGRAGVVGGPAWRGPANLVVRAAVFEAGGGRTTLGRASVPVHPENFYIGLSTGTTKVEAGNEVVVDGITVDWNGSKVANVASVEVEFIRLETEWGWFYDEARGHETWRQYLRPVAEGRREVDVVDGKFQLSLTPAQDGAAFLVRAGAGKARTELHLEGDGDGWYWWDPNESEVERTPRPGRATWLALRTPEAVPPGEPFPVTFNVPYRGRVLLTVETDELLSSEWRDVEPGQVIWQPRVEEFVPNVYLTAFLVKDPHLDSVEAYLPDRAFGVQSVRLEPVEFTHRLAVEAPEEVRSRSRLTVELDLGERAGEGPTFATVAAVDEGVLSLTQFKSPDPAQAIFSRRALGVETFETVGWTLLLPPVGPSSTEGGDAGARLGRVQVVKPVALWSGLVEVPESGKTQVSFELPAYRGELRVMAVSAGTRKMGWAETRVTVRDPLVVQSTLPRFLTQDDTFQVPVEVTNLSGSGRDVTVSLEVENLDLPGLTGDADAPAPVEITGSTEQRLSLTNGTAGTAVFRARTRQPTGAARFTVRVKSGDLESVEESEVPLLPAGPKSRKRQRVELAEGKLDLEPYLTGWLPLSERTTLWVTTNPYGETFSHLDHLLRYPYGCIEQTTSTTRPLLYAGQLVGQAAPGQLGNHTVDDMVRYGVDRVISMQTPDGGFAYWPGGTYPAWWGTAYATDMLLDARELGYPVPEERLNDALEWMERQISNFFEAGQSNWSAVGAEPYFHYVLAKAGKARPGRAEQLLTQLPRRSRLAERENRFLLQAALHISGDHRYEAELRQPDLSPVSEERSNGWSFYSDRRMRGLMLSTLVDLFGRDQTFEPLADLVAGALQGPSPRYTTQELVWGVTGLGKFIEAGAETFKAPVLTAAGRKIEPLYKERNSSDRVWNLARASEYESLTLDVPAKGEGKLYLLLSSEGVRATPDWRTGGEGLNLTRRYLDATGQPLALGGGLNLGDVVYIELTVKNTTAERVANIALVDRIPAGWEIENPRLGRDGDVEWVDRDSLWQADHMNLRDDRLEVFGHLEKGQSRKVVYAVRAVTAGRFTVPPVEAEAMYDPRVWAREGMASVVVRGPWQDGVQGIGAGMN